MIEQPPDDVWSFVHRYYREEMGQPLPPEHSVTVVLVVAAMNAYQVWRTSDTNEHGRAESERRRASPKDRRQV